MADQARLFGGVPTKAEVEADKRERSEDLTPRLVARAFITTSLRASVVTRGVDWARVEFQALGLEVTVSAARPLRVLDVCAGYGVWGSEFARMWVEELGLPREWLHLTAVELDGAKAPHLRKWADAMIIGNWHEALTSSCAYDIVEGNPAFPEARAPKLADGYHPEQSMVALALERAPAVLLYMTQQAWTKTESGYSVRLRYPPAKIWDAPGGIGHRGRGQGKDSVPYSLTLWLRGHEGPAETHMLEPLAAEERGWATPPGAESVEFARAAGLPFAPGYDPQGAVLELEEGQG